MANLSEETKDKLDKHVRLQVRAGHEYRVLKGVQLRVDTKLADKTQPVSEVHGSSLAPPTETAKLTLTSPKLKTLSSRGRLTARSWTGLSSLKWSWRRRCGCGFSATESTDSEVTTVKGSVNFWRCGVLVVQRALREV